MTKVLYDISWLGVMRSHNQSRSGLARAIEEIGQAVSMTPSCEMSLCAGHSIKSLRGARQLLAEGSPLSSIPFASPDTVVESLETTIDRLNSGNQTGMRKVAKAGLRATARVALRAFGRGGLIPPKSLNEASIYHAQYLQVPPQVKAHPRVRRVATIYDLIPIRYPQWSGSGWAETFSHIIDQLDVKDHIICISEFTKADLCGYRRDLDPSRVSVMQLGASNAFHPQTDANEADAVRKCYKIPEGPYFLSVSTQAPHKNFARLIEAFGKMVHTENLRNLSLVLTGSAGWKREELIAALSKWKVAENRIVLTGFVPDLHLPALYSGAHAFVFPSIYEGFGLPVLEAMQCGTPVICSNATSIPEVAGEAAVYFNPLIVDEIAAAMLTVFNDDSLRNKMCSRSLQRSKMFSWKRCGEQVVQAYQNALQS